MKKLLLLLVLLSGCYDLNINPELDTETETETEITCDCPDRTICILGDTENYCIAV